MSQQRLAGAELVRRWLVKKQPSTIYGYQRDLANFASWLGVESLDEAAEELVGSGPGPANGLVLDYVDSMTEDGLAPATINRRLSALRSLVEIAGMLYPELVPWTLRVKNVKSRPYRDTRGPGRDGFLALLRILEDKDEMTAARGRALLRLLYDLSLRRQEIVRLDLEYVDLECSRLWVQKKGARELEPLTLPAPTRDALAAWIAVRGAEPGPLFVNFDRARKGDGRLSGRSIYQVVRELGEEAGIRARPHGLRHTAVTRALDLAGGDVRAVRHFSRHAKIDTLLVYDDARRDAGGEIARLVAKDAEEDPQVGP